MIRASLYERPTARMLLANCQFATAKASEIQYAIDLLLAVVHPDIHLSTKLGRSIKGHGEHTDETQNTPFALMGRNRVEVEVCPSCISLCKGGFGLGYMKTRTFEFHAVKVHLRMKSDYRRL